LPSRIADKPKIEPKKKNYKKYINKGQKIYKNLLERSGDKNWRPDETTSAKLQQVCNNFTATRLAYRYMYIWNELGESCVVVEDISLQGTSILGNIYNYSKKSIIASSNYQDLNDGTSTSWSVAVFHNYKAVTVFYKGSVQNTTFISVVQLNITNKEILDIIKKVYKRDKTRNGNEREWNPNDRPEAFHALLGSPNGSGTGFILLDYNNKLGRQTIKRITTTYNPKERTSKMILYFGEPSNRDLELFSRPKPSTQKSCIII
jgi:hypothetical protein